MAVMKGAFDMAKLLIADDLVPIRQMVRITLSTQGWTILEAENGQKALEIARAEHPDLMLLDVAMGAGPNGFDVCRALKAADDTKRIPLVMRTAHDSASPRAVGFPPGPAQYLTKPVRPVQAIDPSRH